MIEPHKISAAAKKVEEENLRFRTFLKNRADCDELDAQFLELHNELFADYDCCKCNNCCKTYTTVLSDDEISAIADYLGKTEDDFIAEYLEESDPFDTDEGRYQIKELPCSFLLADGKCSVQECKPSSCKGFPFTDQPDRLMSMFSIVSFADECPVVFEMLERLKKLYGFRKR